MSPNPSTLAPPPLSLTAYLSMPLISYISNQEFKDMIQHGATLIPGDGDEPNQLLIGDNILMWQGPSRAHTLPIDKQDHEKATIWVALQDIGEEE